MAEEVNVSEGNEDDTEVLIKQLATGMEELYVYRDLFFERNPIEMASNKEDLVAEKMSKLLEKFDSFDENKFSLQIRAQFLYMKGRTYNIGTKYDPRASQCLSKAVKLNPRHVDAWNELGECYWKNANLRDARSSFEGALRFGRNKVALRCLSIILRQDCTLDGATNRKLIQQSVDLAKEAVSLEYTNGISWSILGNAYLCQYFTIAQDSAVLKNCMCAYRQAELDPIARGHPDLYYNKGVALKYDEQYTEALKCFERASQLDPQWEIPKVETNKLIAYTNQVHDLVKTKGKIKTKKLNQMAQSIDENTVSHYREELHKYNKKKLLVLVELSSLKEGVNEGSFIIGKVVGSIHSENVVPFTFVILDTRMTAICVTVYNWANGRGVIIGDCVSVPEPRMADHTFEYKDKVYNFKSIRVNNPMQLLVNGKRVGREQFAGTRVTSTYEVAK